MIKILYFIISIIALFFLYSCKTYKVMEYQEEYSSTPLYMDEIFFVNCSKDKCNTDLTDSLVLIMKNALFDLDLDIIYQDSLTNVYNDSVWMDLVPPKYYAPNKVNFNYFKQYPYKNEGIKIVPFLRYNSRYGFSTASHTYLISIHFIIFIIDKNETIYEAHSWITNTTHYVPSIDDFNKEDINTSEFIKPVIYKALNPYIERSGNGRVIKEKKDREKRRSENNIKVFN